MRPVNRQPTTNFGWPSCVTSLLADADYFGNQIDGAIGLVDRDDIGTSSRA